MKGFWKYVTHAEATLPQIMLVTVTFFALFVGGGISAIMLFEIILTALTAKGVLIVTGAVFVAGWLGAWRGYRKSLTEGGQNGN